MNYFELYQMPVSLLPDQQLVKQKFYELSRKYHPDFFTREHENDQAEALEVSSEVNRAFKVFSDNDETIKYVLQSKGLLEEEEKYNLPSAFLMEMMELNEQLMEAKMENDAESLRKVKTSIASIEEQIYKPVQSVIEGYDEEVTTTAELLQVKDYYYKKKYLKRILATT
jgi:molecular chaperone HscB